MVVASYGHRSFRVKLLASSPSVFSNSPDFMILELSCPEADSLLFISVYRRLSCSMTFLMYFHATRSLTRTLSSAATLIVIY